MLGSFRIFEFFLRRRDLLTYKAIRGEFAMEQFAPRGEGGRKWLRG